MLISIPFIMLKIYIDHYVREWFKMKITKKGYKQYI